MESNKLLIGVQFIYLKNGTYEHLEFELYVLRDILFYQLLDGIQYGICLLSVIIRLILRMSEANKVEW